MDAPEETIGIDELEELISLKLRALDATPYQPAGLPSGARYAWGELETAYTPGIEGQAVEHLGYTVEIPRIAATGKRAKHGREEVISTVEVRFLYQTSAASEKQDARRAKRAGVDIVRALCQRNDPDFGRLTAIRFAAATWARFPESSLIQGTVTFEAQHDLDTSTP